MTTKPSSRFLIIIAVALGFFGTAALVAHALNSNHFKLSLYTGEPTVVALAAQEPRVIADVHRSSFKGEHNFMLYPYEPTALAHSGYAESNDVIVWTSGSTSLYSQTEVNLENGKGCEVTLAFNPKDRFQLVGIGPFGEEGFTASDNPVQRFNQITLKAETVYVLMDSAHPFGAECLFKITENGSPRFAVSGHIE